jgi:hypothetical protein
MVGPANKLGELIASAATISRTGQALCTVPHRPDEIPHGIFFGENYRSLYVRCRTDQRVPND